MTNRMNFVKIVFVMEKRDYLILFLILVLAVALRLWGISGAQTGTGTVDGRMVLDAPLMELSLKSVLGLNSLAFLHLFYLKILDSLNFLNIYANTIFGTLSVISMFFVGFEFGGEKKGKNLALFCALITAIAPFLIYFSKGNNPYSLSFFLATLVILFSLKIFNNRNKSNAQRILNWTLLIIFSVLLIFEHNISIIFVSIGLLALFVFKGKKAFKEGGLLEYGGMGILILPIVLFVLIETSHFIFPFIHKLAQFSKERILFSLSDLFSFHIVNIGVNGSNLPEVSGLIHNKNTLGIGFVSFVITPTLIALTCILKNFIKPKKVDFYLLTITLSTFFTVLIFSSLAQFDFLTKYILEIYPILILLFAAGLISFKSNRSRVVLVTLFVVLNLFYLTSFNISPTKLVENIPQKTGNFCM